MQEADNRRRIYSVILDFEGIACATQFLADSFQHALRLWFDDLSLDGCYGLMGDQRERLMKSVQSYRWRIEPLQELKHMWWVTIPTEDGSKALLHIVETVVVVGPPPDAPQMEEVPQLQEAAPMPELPEGDPQE